jgi:hypothetical protein
MNIFKKSLPRRTFLQSAGTSVALPFIGAMVPSLTALAQTAASRPKRAGFIYVPHGMIMTETTDYWTPTTAGDNFELSPTLEPLARFRDQLTVVSNLMGADGVGQHTGAPTAWLTDSYPKKTQGADIAAGTSIDQVIASHIGQDTVFPSMQLAIEDVSSLVGTCDAGYACSYLNTVSYATPTNPLPAQVNPRIVFERMFGGTGTAEQRRARMEQNRSILDSIYEESARLGKTLGSPDRARIADYLDNIREVERRIERAEARTDELAATAPDSPVGIPQSFEEHVGIMFDLLHVAYQADISRVFSFMMARDLSALSYPQIGVPEPHHSISHHQNSPETMEKHFKVNRYHIELFANFIDKLANTPDGDGSLLDHSLLMYGSGMSNGNEHIKLRLPTALVSGFVRGNRHIALPDYTKPIGDLHVDIAKQIGIELTSFGQRSKGGTVGLS